MQALGTGPARGRVTLHPVHHQFAGGLHGHPFGGRHHGQEVLLMDHARLCMAGNRAGLDAAHTLAGLWGADHAGVQQAGQRHVGDEVLRAEDFANEVAARHRLPDDAVVRGRFRHRADFDVHQVAGGLVPLDLRVKLPTTDQLGVGHLLAERIAHADGAVAHRQPRHRHGKARRGCLKQDATRFGGGIAQRTAAMRDAIAARGATLVAGQGRVAHDHRDATHLDIELFGHDLRNGHLEAVAHVHLAEEGLHAAVGQDGDPGIELAGQRLRRQGTAGGSLPEHLGQQRSANDQRTAGLQKAAT